MQAPERTATTNVLSPSKVTSFRIFPPYIGSVIKYLSFSYFTATTSTDVGTFSSLATILAKSFPFKVEPKKMIEGLYFSFATIKAFPIASSSFLFSSKYKTSSAPYSKHFFATSSKFSPTKTAITFLLFSFESFLARAIASKDTTTGELSTVSIYTIIFLSIL